MYEFFDSILDWINSGLYQFTVDAATWFFYKSLTGWIHFKILMVTIAFGVADNIFNDLGISDFVNSSISSLPPELSTKLQFFNIFTGFSIMLKAGAAKFVMRFMGW